MKWGEAKRIAKADETLRLIALAIRKANAAGSPDGLAYGVFRDRCGDLGITVPNEAYWMILLGVVLGTL